MARRIALPRRGATNNPAFLNTPKGFVPARSVQNVRPRDGSDGRERFAMRPALARVSGQRLGPTVDSFVQAGAVVSQASAVTGYELGSASRVTAGESVLGDPIVDVPGAEVYLRYNGWILGSDRGLRARLNEQGQNTVTWNDNFGTNSPWGEAGAFPCRWSPDGQYAYIVSIFPIVTALHAIFSITKFDRDGRLITDFGSAEGFPGYTVWGDWGTSGGSPSKGINPNHLVVTNEYLFIAADNYVYVVKASNGDLLQRFDLGGWATESMSLTLRTDGRLAVAFAGRNGTVQKTVGNAALATSPTTLNATAPARDNGYHWRSGVALCDIAPGIVAPGTVLSLVQFGAKRTDALSADYEDHPTFRIAEKSMRVPGFGAIPNAIASCPDGSVVVARCNRGWGRTNTEKPTDTQPLVSLFKIGPGTNGAVMIWEVDVGSLLETTAWASTTVRCDIPVLADTAPLGPGRVNTVGDPHPTLDAVCVSPITGDIYAGGRRAGTNSPFQIYKIRGADGLVLGRKTVGVSAAHWINQNCMAFNAIENTIVVAGLRKDGASDTKHLWILDADTLDLIFEQSLGYSVDAYGLDVSALGEILYTTGKALLP